MSKEATGENGAILGSSEYWDRVNRATFFGRLMRNASDTNYQETLREVGHRAGSAVEEIYDDLQFTMICKTTSSLCEPSPQTAEVRLQSRCRDCMMYVVWQALSAVTAAIASEF